MSEPEETLENRIIDISVIDPVCGMAVNPVEARGKAQLRGADLLFLLARLHAQVCVVAGEVSRGRPRKPRARPAVPTGIAKKLDKDPVCGMDVDASKAAASVEYEGKLYHFCSAAARRNSRVIRKNIFRPTTRRRHGRDGPDRWRPGADRRRTANWRRTRFAG